MSKSDGFDLLPRYTGFAGGDQNTVIVQCTGLRFHEAIFSHSDDGVELRLRDIEYAR